MSKKMMTVIIMIGVLLIIGGTCLWGFGCGAKVKTNTNQAVETTASNENVINVEVSTGDASPTWWEVNKWPFWITVWVLLIGFFVGPELKVFGLGRR